MVVVAIVGILTSIVLPRYETYQAKTKTIEAKAKLIQAWTVEQGFFAEYDSFASCLGSMGYDRTQSGYYAISTTNALIPSGANNLPVFCETMTCFAWAAKSVGQSSPFNTISNMNHVNNAIGNTWAMTADTFVIGAAGGIHGDYNTRFNCDSWSIDQDKNLTHHRVGY